MKKILFIVFSLLVVVNAKDLMPDKTLIEGELKNGFKYTIKKNSRPEKSASFKLLVKVGSLEEDDDQQGIAHLVEHLAFNGSEHFKGNSLVEFLESLGVSFGSHLNASTGMKQTIYMLDVPLKKDNLEKSMLVFSDWAGGLDITQKELDKERGVVLEEERARNSAGYRIYKQIANIVYDKTRYKQRLPIGKKEIIKNISLKRVKDFYTTWYQPRFMHFIAVGDFDEKKIEKLIKKSFKNLKNTNDKKTYSRNAKDVKTTKFEIFKDKEITSMSINLSFVKPHEKTKTQEDFRKNVIENIVRKLFMIKAKEISLSKNPPAQNISMYGDMAGDNLRYYFFTAQFKKNDELKAFKQLLREIYTIDKNGFDKSDFKIAKIDILKGNKEALKDIKNKTSSYYANSLLSDKMAEEISLNLKDAIKLENKLLDTITLEELNEAFRDILKSENRFIYFILPDDYKLDLGQIKQVFEDRKKNIKKIEKSSNLPKSIETKGLKPQKIVSEIYNKKSDFYEFILNNGVKVVYKFNDYEKNQVVLNAFSEGGYSLYEDKILPNAKLLTPILQDSGIDKYDALEAAKIYADKTVSFNPQLDEFFEGFSGDSTTKDFKYLMQGIYLLATKYRIDENIIPNTKIQTLQRLKEEKKSPAIVFAKEFNEFYYKGNRRYLSINEEEIKSVNKKDILKIYKERFSDLNNFTFFIIGDVKKDEVKKYASLYLGNLPTQDRNETYKTRGIIHARGTHEFKRFLNNENISNITLTYTKPTKYSYLENLKLVALSDVLKTKLREYIREEKSGVYGVWANAYISRMPNAEESHINISFSCEPKRRDELMKYVKKIIKEVQDKEVSKKYLNAFAKKSIVGLEKIIKYNSFKSAQLYKFYHYKDKIKTLKEYKKAINSITPKDVRDTAKKYFDTKDVVYSELNPKKKKDE